MCLAPDTVVAGDFKPIQDYRIGDHATGLGDFNYVLNTFRRHYAGSMLTIKANGILPLNVTPEHPILIAQIKEGKDTLISWKPASELTEKDYLLLPDPIPNVDITLVDLHKFVKERGLTIAEHKRPLAFPITEDTAWLLGIYVAEGSAHSKGISLGFNKKEVDLVHRVAHIFKSLGYTPLIREERTVLSVRVCSKILGRAFPEWCGKGAENKRIPQFIIHHKNRELARKFYEGYLAGDGYTTKTREQSSTVSKTLALQLQFLGLKLGDFFHIYEHKSHTKTIIEGREVNRKPSYIISHMLQYNPNTQHIKLSRYIATPIREINSNPYEGEVFNLATGDESYLANNVVVHNCSQSIRREVVSTPWEIVPKDPKLQDDVPTEIQQEIDYVTFFLNSCNPNKESIEQIIGMAVQDLLDLDALTIVKGFEDQSYNKTPTGGLELLPAGQRNLVEIWARDGGSFLKETDVNGEIYRYWQYSYLHPAVAPIEFDINEICYASQYPRSYSVYGWSPLQSMDNILSSLINSAAWNSTFFSEATLPSGIIGVQNMNPEELERFRQYFRTEIKGRWHRIAVVNSDVNYVPFALTNRDMQWLDGQRWYAKLVMAMYNITPTELGFTDDVRATGKAMGAQEEVQKRKSTMPILRLIEQVINSNIINELSENVLFRFTPSDRTEELMQVDVDNKDLDLGKQTVNDIIKKRGLGGQKWWGDEPVNIIIERIKRGEPIPPIQLPKSTDNPTQPQQTPMSQRSFGRVIRKGFEDLDFEKAFTAITKGWPPVANPLTGHAHTQDDTIPHTQDDETRELSSTYQKEISGNRIGNGKEQRDDYLGQQPETIPGANERGQLPTAVGLKPGSFDGRDGMINASDVGHGYPAKDLKAWGITGSERLGSSAGDYEYKPYDDTIDPKARRNIPKDNANTYTSRVVPDGPDGSYGQHPWEEQYDGLGLFHGYKRGVDQTQNPAYNPPQQKQVQPSSGVTAGWEMQAAPPMQVETPEYQSLYKKVLEKNPDLSQERLEQMVQETLRDSQSYQDMFEEEKKEHPSFTDKQIDQIVIDHFKAQKKDYQSSNPQINNSQMQNLQTNHVRQESPDQEKGQHYDPEWGVPQTVSNPIMHAGPHDTLDEHRLDKLRQSPASTNEMATGPGPSGKNFQNAGPGDDGRELIEGESQDDALGTRKAKSEVPATGYLRDPVAEPDLSQHIPSHFRDQQGVSQYLDKEHSTNLVPHPDIMQQKNSYGLDLSGTLQEQIERFGHFTDTTGVEFGALIVRRQGQIILDQVQVGENHEINIQNTQLQPDEEILGTFHIHPTTYEFSVWDCLSFLSSQWEQVSILRAADKNVVVILKTQQTKPIQVDPETLRAQYQGYTNQQLAQEFGFALYKGPSNNLQEIA